jgi:hypothetical protein
MAHHNDHNSTLNEETKVKIVLMLTLDTARVHEHPDLAPLHRKQSNNIVSTKHIATRLHQQ